MKSVCSLVRDEERETVKLTLVSRSVAPLLFSRFVTSPFSLHRFIHAVVGSVSVTQISLQNRRLLTAPWWTLSTWMSCRLLIHLAKAEFMSSFRTPVLLPPQFLFGKTGQLPKARRKSVLVIPYAWLRCNILVRCVIHVHPEYL